MGRWVWMVLVAGCGGEPSHVTHDLAMGSDLATPDLALPDLAPPVPDLARTDDAGDVTQSHGSFHQFVVNHMTMPQQRSDFAIDLNGDGKPDNALGNVIGALTAQGFDAQGSIDQSIASGSAVYLISVQTADAALMNDGMVGFTLYSGVPQANPDFGGMGMFTVDNGVAPAKLLGALVNGAFSSNDPVKTLHPVTVQLKLALLQGQPPVVLPVNGAHAQCTAAVDGLTAGELHGSVKSTDVQKTLIPAIAGVLNSIIAANPGSAQAMQIEQLFDTGGCQNPDGSQAKANDMKIDPCEVSGNQLVQVLLTPDVDIFDGNGNYAPNPANTDKESLSIGLGFTAVKAVF